MPAIAHGSSSSLLLAVGVFRSHPERPPQSESGRSRSVRGPVLHLPALMPRAHGLALDVPRAFLVRAVADGALVRLHLPPGWDDSGLREAVWTWNAGMVCIMHVRTHVMRSVR